MKNKGVSFLNKKSVGIALVCYSIILFWFVIAKCCMMVFDYRHILATTTIYDRVKRNLIPFASIYFDLKEKQGFGIMLFLLNFLILIPLGYLVRFFTNTKISIIIMLLTTLFVEFFQLFTGIGGYDTTDVISNFAGGVYGVVCYNITRYRISDSAYNKIFLIANIFIVIFTLGVLVQLGFTLPKYL